MTTEKYYRAGVAFVLSMVAIAAFTTVQVGAAPNSTNKAIVLLDSSGANLGNLISVSRNESNVDQYTTYVPTLDAVLKYEVDGSGQVSFANRIDTAFFTQLDCQGPAYSAVAAYPQQWVIAENGTMNFYKLGNTTSISPASVRVNGTCSNESSDPIGVFALTQFALGNALGAPTLPLTISAQ
jgi:hypothetical protein